MSLAKSKDSTQLFNRVQVSTELHIQVCLKMRDLRRGSFPLGFPAKQLAYGTLKDTPPAHTHTHPYKDVSFWSLVTLAGVVSREATRHYLFWEAT